MDVRPVRMFVLEREMRVLMAVRFAQFRAGRMLVLMMKIVVRVRVGVRDLFMPVPMRVMF